MNLEELAEKQVRIGEMVRIEEPKKIEYVIGVDQSFFKKGKKEYIISVSVLFEFPELRLVDENYVVEEINFPYIPTFLMFRESDAGIKAIEGILRDNSLAMVDGSGLAHPRKCGLATYIGVVMGIPSIGVTKKKLFGEVKGKGEVKEIFAHGMKIGYEIKTCRKCKPIYISVGNMITPERALDVVRKTLKGHKLPEPIRIADRKAKELRLKYLSNL